MSDLVPAERIEQIVGVQRHATAHYGRAVSAERTVYILHSKACLDSGRDLRDCGYSIALDRGIERRHWEGKEDQPMLLGLGGGRLLPLREGSKS